MTNVDVTNDFLTERNHILTDHPDLRGFSLGDYVVRALVGATDCKIDSMNEPRKEADSESSSSNYELLRLSKRGRNVSMI